MPYIRKEKAGSCPGYTWEHDGDVVEIDDPYLVGELLEIPGFSEVAPPKGSDKPGGGGVDEEPSAPRKRAPRKPAQTEISE